MTRCRDLKTLEALVARKRAAQAAGRSGRPDPERRVRLLGVDTALRTTGFGLVDCEGSHLTAVDCGVIQTAARQPLSECLRRLAGGIRELVRTYAPDEAVIEGGSTAAMSTRPDADGPRSRDRGAGGQHPDHEYAPRR